MPRQKDGCLYSLKRLLFSGILSLFITLSVLEIIVGKIKNIHQNEIFSKKSERICKF
jgi:hypothetical protein